MSKDHNKSFFTYSKLYATPSWYQSLPETLCFALRCRKEGTMSRWQQFSNLKTLVCLCCLVGDYGIFWNTSIIYRQKISVCKIIVEFIFVLCLNFLLLQESKCMWTTENKRRSVTGDYTLHTVYLLFDEKYRKNIVSVPFVVRTLYRIKFIFFSNVPIKMHNDKTYWSVYY